MSQSQVTNYVKYAPRPHMALEQIAVCHNLPKILSNKVNHKLGETMMKEFLLTLLIGIAVGVIDILPMLKMKLDKYSISSAFIHFLIAPFIIFNTDLFGMTWWSKGGVIPC